MANWIIEDEWDYNNFRWKIPSVSSIPHVVGYAVHSPPFSLEGTTWTMKMYPNGDSRQNEGHISVIIERSNTQGEVYCYWYCEENSIGLTYLDSTHISNSEKKASIPCLMRNLKESSQDPDIITEDTFYLVLELWVINRSFNECSSAMKSAAENVGTKDGNENVVGEIFKEYEGCKKFFYNISDIPRGLSFDYHIESPRFSFMNATWIVKLWPYHRMEDSQNRNVEIVLERLESEVPVQNVELEIEVSDPFSTSKEESIYFSSSQTQSPAFNFQLNKQNETDVKFRIYIKVLKTENGLIEPRNKSVEKAAADDDKPESSMMAQKGKALEDYKKLFFEKEDCDVLFKVKGHELLAHKNIIKVRSPVLASALRHEMKEKITGVINIDDCEPSHFCDFLCFLYCAEVENLATENVFSLFTIADKYEVLDLKTVCTDFIKCNLTIDTFCETISLALLHCEADLLKLSTEFFAKNRKDIMVTTKWQSFISENPIQCNEFLLKAMEINNDESRLFLFILQVLVSFVALDFIWLIMD